MLLNGEKLIELSRERLLELVKFFNKKLSARYTEPLPHNLFSVLNYYVEYNYLLNYVSVEKDNIKLIYDAHKTLIYILDTSNSEDDFEFEDGVYLCGFSFTEDYIFDDYNKLELNKKEELDNFIYNLFYALEHFV